jgi:hypothetical protein
LQDGGRWLPLMRCGAKPVDIDAVRPILHEAVRSLNHVDAAIGTDLLMLARLISSLRTGAPTDINVYDAATWSGISELTEQSVVNRSRTMDIPDFTRGLWRTTPPLEIVTTIRVGESGAETVRPRQRGEV